MIGHIYYIFGFIPLLLGLAILLKLRKHIEIDQWCIKFEEITKNKPTKEDFRSPEEFNLKSGVEFINGIDLMWMILGIVSQSWYIFISLIMLSLVVSTIKKAIGFNTVSTALTGILLFAKISIYLFLIINHFHLHYDILRVIK
jgi:hypothetical protein